MSDSAQQTLAAPTPRPSKPSPGIGQCRHGWSFFTGAERLAFAAHRVARGSQRRRLNSPIMASTAARVRRKLRAAERARCCVGSRGARRRRLRRAVAVVALVCSIDSYRIGLGAPLDPLPAPVPGDLCPTSRPMPSRRTPGPDHRHRACRRRCRRCPTNAPPRASSATPGTSMTSRSTPTTPSLAVTTRAQMELVASRTSWLNECFDCTDTPGCSVRAPTPPASRSTSSPSPRTRWIRSSSTATN